MGPRRAAALLAVLLASCAAPVGDAGAPADGAGPRPPAAGAADDATTPDVTVPPVATPAGTTVFVRSNGAVTAAELAQLSTLDGVVATQALRRDDVALWGSARSDGTAVDDLPDGFKISVGAVVDDPSFPVHPSPGEVLLTATGAAFRDLDPGGTVVLGGTRRTLVVADVVDDPAYGDAELVVHPDDADELPVRALERVALELAEGSHAEAVAAAARTIIDDVERDGQTVAVRVPTGMPLVLSLSQVKARFGEFAFMDLPGVRDVQVGVSWIEENVRRREVPLLGEVRCHRLVLDDLEAVMQQLVDTGLAGEIDPDLYGGCWVPRRIDRDSNLSRHAWGIAVDVNVDFAEPGGGPLPSLAVIDAFADHGFQWGGYYPFPDNHHFEWVGP